MTGTAGARFLHEHPRFEKILSAVANVRRLQAPLVEKDYWITHTLWAIEKAGLRVYFKGGTSLSKAFGLIERFSEDLDIMIEGPDLPVVRSWTSKGSRARESRIEFFRAFGEQMRVPGAKLILNPEVRSRGWRKAVFEVRFPSRTMEVLPEAMRPFVQLEIGHVRKSPIMERKITSWIHDYVVGQPVGLDSICNSPAAIRCVLPEVTLLEKIEAIARRYGRTPFSPASFVRHYEDAAAIIRLHPLPNRPTLRDLLKALCDEKAIRQWPKPDDPSLNSIQDSRWSALQRAWTALEAFHWGPRTTLAECTRTIREFLVDLGPTAATT